jgi:hypothetical protein
MVTRRSKTRGAGGYALLEILIAMSMLTIILAGYASINWQEGKLAREYYYRAVAAEVVDGEMEALAASEWQAYPKGSQAYPVKAESAKNLPPGKFVLTVEPGRVRLEWLPASDAAGGRVVREAAIQ